MTNSERRQIAADYINNGIIKECGSYKYYYNKKGHCWHKKNEYYDFIIDLKVLDNIYAKYVLLGIIPEYNEIYLTKIKANRYKYINYKENV